MLQSCTYQDCVYEHVCYRYILMLHSCLPIRLLCMCMHVQSARVCMGCQMGKPLSRFLCACGGARVFCAGVQTTNHDAKKHACIVNDLSISLTHHACKMQCVSLLCLSFDLACRFLCTHLVVKGLGLSVVKGLGLRPKP